MDEIDVRVIDDPGIDPQTAFAKLRSYTPNRGCFLLESRGEGDEARYSMVGYRVRRGEMMPPGVDAIRYQADEHRKLPRPDSFAAAICRGAVGYFAANNFWLAKRVQLFEDEGSSGQLAVDCAAIIWDHVAHTVTAAGRKQGNQAERIAWELTHEAHITLDPATPNPTAVADGLRALCDESRYAARGKRAKAFLGDEVEHIVLAQMFHAPAGASDPFDAYRAHFALSQARHGYYIDFGESPAAPHVRIYGVADEMLSLRRRDAASAEGSFADDLYARLPDPERTGSPTLEAMKLIRRLEENSHYAWGGAAGYSCPGGEAAFVACDQVVTIQDGTYFYHAGVRMTADDDPAALHGRAREIAGPALAAIKYAQARSY